jgi:hypothetical protein
MTATTIVVSSPGAAGMVSSSAQITELVPLMAYTASLKSVAIVSSSQQIQNYNLFAVTSSANTFYGNQTITGSLDVRGTAGNGIKLRHSNGTNIAEINELSGVQGAGFALKNSSGTQNILLNAGGDSYINGGNLGVGVTPNSWNGGGKAIEIGMIGSAHWGLDQTSTYRTTNAYWNSGWKYGGTGAAVNYAQEAGSHYWSIAPSGTAGNAITFIQSMVLTSDGYLGIGKNSVNVSNGDLIGLLAFKSNDSSTNSAGAIASIRSYATADYNTGNVEGDMRFYISTGNAPNGSLLSGNECARFSKSGFFKASNDGDYNSAAGTVHEIKTTLANQNIVSFVNSSSTSPYGPFITFPSAAPNNSTNYFLGCGDSTNTRFELRSNGGLANYAANDVTLSDERTKKDIIPLESYWDKFKAIEIVKFKYKDQTHDDYNIGVISQQVELVAPEFVDIDGFGTTPEDGIPLKSIYTADLYHATIKVLQEAMIKIEQLEIKIAQLENN